MDREKVSRDNIYLVAVLHADSVACTQLPIGSAPVNQTLLDLVTHATNPLRLASMDPSLLPWL